MGGMSLEPGTSAAIQPAKAGHVLPLVTGAVLRPDADVRFDGYGHAWIAPTSLAPTTLAPLNDEARLGEGLVAFARAAAPRRAALLDVQPQGCGRDAAALARLSAKSGVAIAAVTGFHPAAHYPAGRRPWITADAALATFQRELDGGMREQPVARPAAVAAALGSDAPDDDPCWEAALEACRRSGALLLVRLEPDADLADLVRFLSQRGVAGERTYICRMDGQPDDGLHRELASAGALLGYRGSAFVDDARHSGGAGGALERRLEDGHSGAVAIGFELAAPGAWGHDRAGQDDGAGPAAAITAVERRLRELGAADHEVDALLGKNLLARAARPETLGVRG
jgi:predicted metal-dependent phosphotriesterase family hydrolase